MKPTDCFKLITTMFFCVSVMLIGCIANKKPPSTGKTDSNLTTLDTIFILDQITLKFKQNSRIKLEDIRKDNSLQNLIVVSALLKKYNVESFDRPFKSKSLRSVYRLTLKEKRHSITLRLLEELKELPYVEYAELIPVVKADVSIPNDPLNTNQYYLGLAKVYQAFDIHQGGSKVAIIDTGFDMDHEDLVNTIWTNPGEIAANGLDDDGNGYIDDVHGWDTGDSDNDPNLIPQTTYSNYWHGTHVAGIAGADTNNGIGVTSIGYDNDIIPIKATVDSYGGLDMIAVINAITYAIEVGADVINLSLSSGAPYTPLQTECANANIAGIVVVASAGNLTTPSKKLRYPAFYPEVICVAATNSIDQLMYLTGGQILVSNYGDEIDICAPGVSIFNTMPNDTYSNKNGTSMAAPIIAGLAGLMKSNNPSMTPQQFKDCIQKTAIDIDPLNPGYAGWLGEGRVDAEQAILCNGTCPSSGTITVSALTTVPNLTEFPVGNNITFSSSTTGTISSFEWTVFKNGYIIQTGTTTVPNFTFFPNSIGNYKIKMRAKGISNICDQIIYQYFKVVCGVNASFTMNNLVTPGDPLNVVNTSTNSGNVHYVWYIDGVATNLLPPTNITIPGSYLLKLEAINNDYSCSEEYAIYFTVFECPIDPPILNDRTVCLSQNVNLSPLNNTGNFIVNWYDQLADVTPLHTGANYNVGAINTVGIQDYFVEYVSKAPTYFVGESSSPGGQGAYNSNYSELYITSNVNFYFNSFKVHVSTGGNISFTLKNSSSSIVWQVMNHSVSSGIELIDGYNTFCPAGTYTLTKEYTSGAPWMWEYSNSSFPYQILNGDFSITGTWPPNRYPAYYDINIATESDCISPREDVLVTVVNDNNDSDGDGICDSADQCPGLDDNLIGTPCDDSNNCTENDIYDNNCNCIGTPMTSFNLVVKDNPSTDNGIEPNPGDIWNGNIWNCVNGPGCTGMESPEYKTSGYNSLMVHIDNLGCGDHQAGESRLHLYWTIGRAGELWTEHWFDPLFEPTNLVSGIPAGSEITPSGGVPIPFIPGGGSNFVELDHNWTPPNPANFPSISSTPMICFLARIVSIKDPIVGESIGAISNNVKNSNNIATVNSTLVDIDPFNKMFPSYFFYLNNPTTEPVTVNLMIEELESKTSDFFKSGSMEITLKDDEKGEKEKKITIKNKADLKKLQRIRLEPNQLIMADFQFKYAYNNKVSADKEQFKLKIKSEYDSKEIYSTEFNLKINVGSK